VNLCDRTTVIHCGRQEKNRQRGTSGDVSKAAQIKTWKVYPNVSGYAQGKREKKGSKEKGATLRGAHGKKTLEIVKRGKGRKRQTKED